MKSAAKFCVLFLFSAFFAGLLLSAQSELPEGKGKEIVESVCAQCHGLATITDSKRTLEEWRSVVYDMVSEGAPLLDEEVEIVAQYLAKNFGPESGSGKASKTSAKVKINVNQPTVKELQAGLEGTVRGATAVGIHREKHGDFGNWEELSKAPGQDPKRIAGIKDRPAF